MAKKYGLLKPGELKKPLPNFSRPSIFGDDSSEDEEKPQKIGLTSEMQKKQAKLLQEKALEEDPTVYQYDELYDELSAKKEEEKAKKVVDKKPKYIERLLHTAAKRKIENERRIERQVQKEREEEGEQFKDKEAFVTASYRKKLEELRKAEEEEAREAYLEEIGDVKRQGNLDGFYRHIYAQKLEDEKSVVKPDLPSTSEEPKDIKKPKSKVRSYRKRQSEDETSEKSEDEETKAKKAHLENNLDADSDFSIDESSSDEEGEKKQEKATEETKPETSEATEFAKPADPTVLPAETNGKDEEAEEKPVEPPPPKKEKVDIWKKRTVGEAFDAALQRYFERKALREQMSRQV